MASQLDLLVYQKWTADHINVHIKMTLLLTDKKEFLRNVMVPELPGQEVWKIPLAQYLELQNIL